MFNVLSSSAAADFVSRKGFKISTSVLNVPGGTTHLHTRVGSELVPPSFLLWLFSSAAAASSGSSAFASVALLLLLWCLGRVAVRILGVVPSGLSPRGVASFVHARLELRRSGVEWSAIYPVPAPTPVPDPQWCPVCPHPAGLRLPFWRASRCSPSTGGIGLRATAAGGRECAVRCRGFGEFGLGGQRAQQRYPLPPLTELPYLIEARHRRR